VGQIVEIKWFDIDSGKDYLRNITEVEYLSNGGITVTRTYFFKRRRRLDSEGEKAKIKDIMRVRSKGQISALTPIQASVSAMPGHSWNTRLHA
jgi:hypothetical protein